MITEFNDEELVKYITNSVLPKNIPIGSMLLIIRPLTTKSDEEIIVIIDSIKEAKLITAPSKPSPFGKKNKS